MDILTLELLDVTVFQALLELRGLLADHPGEAMRIRGEDDLLRVNVTGFLEKQGRAVRVVRQGALWELQVAQASRPVPLVSPVAPTARPSLPGIVPWDAACCWRPSNSSNRARPGFAWPIRRWSCWKTPAPLASLRACGPGASRSTSPLRVWLMAARRLAGSTRFRTAAGRSSWLAVA